MYNTHVYVFAEHVDYSNDAFSWSHCDGDLKGETLISNTLDYTQISLQLVCFSEQ